MGPVLAGLLGTGISAVAGIFGQAGANRANAREAQLNRDFQADQSATAYQRSMADMKKAGLNPMLAYQQGGASTPSGSMAQMDSVTKDVGRDVASAMSLVRAKADIDALKANTQLMEKNSALALERMNTEKSSQASNYANSALALERARTEGTQQGLNVELLNTQRELTYNQQKVGQKLLQEVFQATNATKVSDREALVAGLEADIDRSGFGKAIRKWSRLKDAPGGSLLKSVITKGR